MSALGVPSIVPAPCASVSMPALAFGAGTQWMSRRAELQADLTLPTTLATAINLGFRHVDCAEFYNNEALCGQGIKLSGVPRDQLFITSKIYASLDTPEQGLKTSLSRLGLTHLDLYLVHAPFKFSTSQQLHKTWAQLEDCVARGYTKAIGVSNFRVQDLRVLLETAKIKPLVNQIEFHPYLQSTELFSFCQENGIRMAAYGCLAPILSASGGPLDPVLAEISSRTNKTTAQVLIRWALQKGCVVVTTTSKENRMKEYLGTTGFALDDRDVAAIDNAGGERAFRKYWRDDFISNSKSNS